MLLRHNAIIFLRAQMDFGAFQWGQLTARSSSVSPPSASPPPPGRAPVSAVSNPAQTGSVQNPPGTSAGSTLAPIVLQEEFTLDDIAPLSDDDKPRRPRTKKRVDSDFSVSPSESSSGAESEPAPSDDDESFDGSNKVFLH